MRLCVKQGTRASVAVLLIKIRACLLMLRIVAVNLCNHVFAHLVRGVMRNLLPIVGLRNGPRIAICQMVKDYNDVGVDNKLRYKRSFI